MAVDLDHHLFAKGPKRILSLDGGGVRGLIALGVLTHVEAHLAQRSGTPDQFRLSHYFDLIGGVSTGALIASMLCLGLPVARIVDIYFKIAPCVFCNHRMTAGWHAKFDAYAFECALQDVMGELLTKDLGQRGTDCDAATLPLSSNLLQTGLAIIAKRFDTNSVWVLTNNPRSKYWTPDNHFWQSKPPSQREIFIPNANYALLQVLRASASAPYYFDPLQVQISETQVGWFIDGGASSFNNPSQELFLLTALKPKPGTNTHSPTGFEWETGVNKLLMLSIGTGRDVTRRAPSTIASLPAARVAINALHGIIENASEATTAWMQSISRGTASEWIDSNLGNLSDLTLVSDPLLTFNRINPTIHHRWLRQNLGRAFSHEDDVLSAMQAIDNADISNLNRCFELGLALGEKLIRSEVFPSQFDIST